MKEEVSMDMDPQRFTELGYRVVDMMADWLRQEVQAPVLPPASGEEMAQRLNQPVPRESSDPDTVLQEIADNIQPFCRHNGHPRFFAYIMASADPAAILADALASAFNQNLTAWRSAPAAATIERLVLSWLDQWLGFAGQGHGILLSGGSAANLNAINCALMRTLEHNPKADRGKLTLYVSSEVHSSTVKAGQMLGLDDAHIRIVEVDDSRRMLTSALNSQIEQDRAQGLIPFCVCASSGTANAGTLDPLAGIADVCQHHHVWFHIDGAYGAPAAATQSHRFLRDAFARADSLSLDPHKWLFAPMDVACLLLRREQDSHRAFAMSAEVYKVSQTEPLEAYAFFNHGMELSRRFRALKVWMTFKVHGGDKIAAVIERNIKYRELLDRLIAQQANLEVVSSGLSISCFRYRPPQLADKAAINDLNQRVLDRLLADNEVWMSPIVLDRRFCLRICITNFRTAEQDIHWLVERVLQVGDELS